MQRLILGLFLTSSAIAAAQLETDPAITGWYVNLDNKTGQSPNGPINTVVSAIQADVLTVSYSDSNVYIESTGIPSHPVGPFNDGNPAIPVDMEWLIRVPRTVLAEDPIHAETSLGAIGMFVNGVAVYNMSDAQSFENEGVWNNNAIIVRADGFDAALGHPSPLMMGPPPPPPGGDPAARGMAPPPHMGPPPRGPHPRPGMEPFRHRHPASGLDEDHTHRSGGSTRMTVDGEYHYHQQSPALREQLGDDGTHHSPILGYAFDGFPIYGPYGYDNTEGGGGIVRIESSYRLRDIAVRHELADGTLVPMNQWGPDVSGTYPLGYFIEDYEYVPGFGHLDEFNGRFAVTPEFPEGVYAYYATIDDAGESAFPYLLGPSFYGMPLQDNMTGNVVKPGGLTVYTVEDEAEALRDALADGGEASAGLTYAGAKALLSTLTLGQFAVLDVDGDGTVTLEELVKRSLGETGTAMQVWVDFENAASGQDGTVLNPFDTIVEANEYVRHDGTGVITILGPASTPERVTLDRPVYAEASGGSVTIGSGAP